MNNRSQQLQDNMRRTQQAADQSRQTREMMQRQQDVMQRSRENSQRFQHAASLQQSEFAVRDNKLASSPGCGLRLTWIIRNVFLGAIGFGGLTLFFTHGGNDPGAGELALHLATIGAILGFLNGVFRKPG